MALRYEAAFPERPRPGAPLVVLLHGRGSDERDLLGLRPHFPDGVLLVTPRAPFEASRWGYGTGWAWYRYLERDRPEPDSFVRGLEALRALLRELPARLPVEPGPLVLGGFSQGGTVSLAYALRHPGAAPLVLNFSGFLADHPDVEATADTVKGTRFFWGHGTRDPAIPFALAEEGRAALREVGARLEARDYPIGHGITSEEAGDAGAWVRQHLTTRTTRGE